jgi:hypothetical protein
VSASTYPIFPNTFDYYYDDLDENSFLYALNSRTMGKIQGQHEYKTTETSKRNTWVGGKKKQRRKTLN